MFVATLLEYGGLNQGICRDLLACTRWCRVLAGGCKIRPRSEKCHTTVILMDAGRFLIMTGGGLYLRSIINIVMFVAMVSSVKRVRVVFFSSAILRDLMKNRD